MSDGLKLLSSVIATGSIHILREVPRDWFHRDELPVYDCVRSHYRTYGRIPAVETIEDEIDVDIPDAPETPDYYIARMHDRLLYSIVKDKFNTLKNCLRDYDMDAAKEAIAELQAATRLNHTSSDIRNAREAMDAVLVEYDHAHMNPGLSGIPSLWPTFDYSTGGMQPGDLITWVARPEVGKTYVLLRQAQVAWQLGYSVLVVTMEMTIEQITRRLAGMCSGINPDLIRKGMLSNPVRQRLEQCIDGLAMVDRLRLFSGGMKKTVGDVDLLVQEFKPDVVFIDGVYLMRPTGGKQLQRLERVAEVFDEIKQMALAQNVPVVVTTQFSRQAGKKGKEGSLENIAYSDAISTHSSIILALGEAKDSDIPASKKRVVTSLKGREGEFMNFEINFSFAPVNFTEIQDPTKEVDGDGNPIEEMERRSPSQPNLDYIVGEDNG